MRRFPLCQSTVYVGVKSTRDIDVVSEILLECKNHLLGTFISIELFAIIVNPKRTVNAEENNYEFG